MWHKLDRYSLAPWSILNARLLSSKGFGSADDYASLGVLRQLVLDWYDENYYDAEVLNYAMGIEVEAAGLQLYYRGYSSELLRYASEIVDKLAKFEYSDDEFTAAQSAYKAELASFAGSDQYLYALEYGRAALTEYYYLPSAVGDSNVDSISKTSLEEFHGSLFESLYGVLMVQGNTLKSDAKDLGETFDSTLSHGELQSSDRVSVQRVHKIDKNSRYALRMGSLSTSDP